MMGTTCARCGQRTLSVTMSRFNTEMICPECENTEQQHPRYEEAREAEAEAVRQGNYYFPGIGKPDDL